MFNYVRHIRLLTQIFPPAVLRSIPAAGSTFAAFEITRGTTISSLVAAAVLTKETPRIPQGLDWGIILVTRDLVWRGGFAFAEWETT